MIWLTWRQFRGPAAIMFAALAALAAVLAITGPGLADEYSSGTASCPQNDCSAFTRQFFEDHQIPFFVLILVVLLLPALIGLFWGAPLIARELETGTHRLVWNQSVTRTRWLAVKLGLIGVAAMAAAALGSLATAWWSSPIDKSAVDDISRMSPLMFDARGIAPIAYAAFAFTLGVTIGMLVRRTLAAMTITLAVFAAVQIAMPLLVRPHLLPASSFTTTVTRDNLQSLMAKDPNSPIQISVKAPGTGAWVLSNKTLEKSGRTVKVVPLYLNSGPCAASGEGPRGLGPSKKCLDEINRLGYRQQVTYQPSGRFWALQGVEAGIYGALTLGLAGFCLWWIRRRAS